MNGGGSGLVAWPVFKTATETSTMAPVGSIPTRSRHPDPGRARWRARVVAALLVLAVVGAPPSQAQEPTDTARVPAAAVDTAGPRRPVSPMGAFFRSFLIPGWGQAKLNRKLTGGIFVAWEGVTLGMSIKASHELGYLRRINSTRVESKEQELEDWITLLIFNHLFAGLEAYVSAHLWDFPEDIRLRPAPVPGGGVAGVITIPLP